MGVAGDLLVTILGVVLVVAAPLEFAFAALVAFWLLVPGNLEVPYAPHLFLVHRVVLYAFAFRLVIRHGRGQPSFDAYKPTPMLAALGALLAVSFLDGVVLAQSADSVSADLHYWFTVLDLAVLFVVVLAVMRTISLRRAVNVVVPVLAVAVGIGIWERFFHHGWAAFFFEHVPGTDLSAGSGPLATRGGHVRSQAAAQFALEYGWVLAMLLPLSIFAATRWGRSKRRWARLSYLLPPLVVVAIVFSASRVPQAAAAVAIILLVVAAGLDRRLLVWGASATVAGVWILLLHSSFITSPFSTASTTDPASIRLNRLPPLFSLVHNPFTGLGFNGIASYFGGLDDAYALVYATIGVLGLLAWMAVGTTALATTARALRASPGSDTRIIGAACFAGIVVFAAAAANYDLVDTAQSTWTLIFLAAMGTAAAESVAHRAPARRWAARLLLPAGGVGLGFAVMAAVPAAASESLSVFTVAPWVIASQPGAVATSQGKELVDTLCPVVTNPDTLAPGTKVNCLQASDIFPADYPGLALVTVSAATPAAVRAEIDRAFEPIARNMSLEFAPVGTISSGKPSWAATAPLSGGVAGLMAMLLCPPVVMRRRRAGLRTQPKRRHGALASDPLPA